MRYEMTSLPLHKYIQIRNITDPADEKINEKRKIRKPKTRGVNPCTEQLRGGRTRRAKQLSEPPRAAREGDPTAGTAKEVTRAERRSKAPTRADRGSKQKQKRWAGKPQKQSPNPSKARRAGRPKRPRKEGGPEGHPNGRGPRREPANSTKAPRRRATTPPRAGAQPRGAGPPNPAGSGWRCRA